MITEPQVGDKKYIPYARVDERDVADNHAPGERIKVRCIAPEGLYYDFLRRREGDVFYLYPIYKTVVDGRGRPVKENGQIKREIIPAKKQFSENNMEMLESDEPETITTAQSSIDKKTNELNQTKAALAK